jgi:hypothetical protein
MNMIQGFKKMEFQRMPLGRFKHTEGALRFDSWSNSV